MINFFKRVYFYYQVFTLLMKRRIISTVQIQKDYDRLSRGYDEYFSKFMRKHSVLLIEKLKLEEGYQVLDLACGTGTITFEIAKRVGKNGKVYGVDSSSGMLQVAESKKVTFGLKNVEFLQGDMLERTRKFLNNSFDVVTCGWAIAYVNPELLLKEIYRILKDKGKVGIIENIRDTLRPIRKTAIKVAQSLPEHLKFIMDLHIRLPKNTKSLKRLFKKANLQPLDIWEGEEEFKFKRGKEVLDWVLRTGASAGFSQMMAPEVKQRCDELFIEYIEKDYLKEGIIKVSHQFVAGIGEKI
jgi:ubiquinone/menaquinone biosynthesis C-methylase UbiE